ncbi:hypothetical protein GYB22_05350 [bacterium]|nr:hypothetical protein [bacterium]
MIKKLLYLLCFSCLVNSSVFAQLDNSFFDLDKYDQPLDSSHLQFEFDNLSYFRNTEYSSLVDKGSTFPGFHLLPYVKYSFNKNAELSAGLFLRYDFGNPQIKTLEPYFKFKYRLWGHDLIFGNLEGSVQHRLIEPLFDYEYAVTNRMEHGLQIKYPGKHIDYDFWIDWQKTIYQDDPFNEIFFGGLNLYVNPIVTESTKLKLNTQFLTVHSAGEIDRSIESNTMEYNIAFGIIFEHQFNPDNAITLSGHAAFYEDYSRPSAYGFRDGLGQFAFINYTHKTFQFVLTYWDAHQFQAPVGDRLYQSVGRKNINNPIDYRKVIGFRIANELKIGHNLVFLNRLGLNYNIDHAKADVIMENYLRWHFSLKPKQVKLY